MLVDEVDGGPVRDRQGHGGPDMAGTADPAVEGGDLRWIDMHVDPDLELHVILDNLSAHKSQPVRDWLAHKKRRRWHLHFTPTSSSWLNLVECWFSVLSRKALTNTSFTSVAELETRIEIGRAHV